MNKYPNIVKIFNIINLKEYGDHCPFCDSSNVSFLEGSGTLVGYQGEKYSKQDPNHYTYIYYCKSCKNKHVKNFKREEIWITDLNQKVLKGMPNCFENYILTCNFCNGDVERKYTELDGITKINSLHYSFDDNGKQIKHFKEFYCCNNCGKIEEL